AQERRGHGERVDGGADIVPVPRQGELSRPAAAANGVPSLDQENRPAGRGEDDGSGQAVRARSHHHGATALWHATPGVPRRFAGRYSTSPRPRAQLVEYPST